MRLPSWISQHLAAFRAVLVFTALTGLAYPLAVLGVAQLPGLRDHANGSIIELDGKPVGSELIGQLFQDAESNPDPRYFQSRPSMAGGGYDPDATAASNLGPESIEDSFAADGGLSLLTQVCARSVAVAKLEGVDGARPFCTAGGVGAALRVFYSEGLKGTVTRAVSVNERCPAIPFLAEYEGVRVECGRHDEDYSKGVLLPIRGSAPAEPEVPADAVSASASGLDPHISVAYARLQAPRVARERGLSTEKVSSLIGEHTTGRALGFLGEPGVNVLQLNLALDSI